MLRLTQQAAAYLVRLRQRRGHPDTVIPRIERRDGRLKVAFRSGPSAGDRLVDDGGTAVLVAASADDLLKSATIDVVMSDGKEKLVVDRTHVRSARRVGLSGQRPG